MSTWYHTYFSLGNQWLGSAGFEAGGVGSFPDDRLLQAPGLAARESGQLLVGLGDLGRPKRGLVGRQQPLARRAQLMAVTDVIDGCSQRAFSALHYGSCGSNGLTL